MESRIEVINARDLLDEARGAASMVFMDPPDNIGLPYGGYKDKIPEEIYYSWLQDLLLTAMMAAPCVWMSYYWQHDVEIKARVAWILKRLKPSWRAKTCIWRYTFGQYVDTDFGSGFRFLLRLTAPSFEFNDAEIRVQSRRQAMGDTRAAGPRVPDDVFEFPRVVGNSADRRSWHPTQHPDKLLDRIVRSSTKEGGLVVDPFMGTGTTYRVAIASGRRCWTGDIDADYVSRVRAEHAATLRP